MKWDSEYNQEWQTKFAWFPVYIHEEYKVWLEKYQVRYVPKESKGCEWCKHHVGRWETRFYEPESPTILTPKD